MTSPTLGWAAGLVLFVLLPLIVVAVGACIVGEDKSLRRLRDMERGRLAQRADYIERSCHYHQDVQ